MKKMKLNYLFGITGVILLLISCFAIQVVSFNISDTYYLIGSMQFGLLIFLQYVLYTFAYFSIGKNSNRILGILNLLFITLPILYFMFPDIISGNINPRSYLEHPFLLDFEVYFPRILLATFLIGQTLFVINLIIGGMKRKVAST
jgi:hypothetical protein